MKLFCLPYAGGSSYIYYKWGQHLHPDIQLAPVELAGRGKRIHDALYKDAEEAFDDVFRIISSGIDDLPYALFGHSMGGLIAYKVAHRLAGSGLPAPVHLFFSGKSAPHVYRPKEKKYHLMEEAVFEREVIDLGGTPPDLFEHPELKELFLPLLRNDFRIAETELHSEAFTPFGCDITVFLGKLDDMNTEQCEGWREHTTGVCDIHYFEGGHFFIQDETPGIAGCINKALRMYLPERAFK